HLSRDCVGRSDGGRGEERGVVKLAGRCGREGFQEWREELCSAHYFENVRVTGCMFGGGEVVTMVDVVLAVRDDNHGGGGDGGVMWCVAWWCDGDVVVMT
nr:hypothetical protein [Tanacetum cinerariifolium]